MKFPEKLQNKLSLRKKNQALRKLGTQTNLIDFSSNDYLGFAKSETLFNETHLFLTKNNLTQNGATGSRLLSGNHILYDQVEKMLCQFHKTNAAIIFNSGYDANLGFFSSIPQRGDIILFDELSHASIRDGINLSNAKSVKFKHNNNTDLENKILKFVQNGIQEIYVITESVFSMDGDSPDLISMSKICKKYDIHLIIDEAHAIGVFGCNGHGLVQSLGLEKEIFARIITFGKAIGCHGAAILGSKNLKEYLINFSRSFIYTTGLSPHSLATIKTSYETLDNSKETQNLFKLKENIEFFKSEVNRLSLKFNFTKSNSTIHSCIISGNQKVKNIAQKLQELGFDVKPILSPTVSEGEERLRFCLHSYNSKKEITTILENLATFV